MNYPFVNIHTHSRSGNGIELVSAMALTDPLPSPPCSLGIHPWQVGEIDTEAALKDIETCCVNAVGEIGLDFSKSNDRGLQKMILSAQLRIAEERGLPVILHSVKSFEPLADILREYRLPAVIFHGFVGSAQQVRVAVERGYYLSFGERSFASAKTVEAMSALPSCHMLLETDESETSIEDVYLEASRLTGTGMDELKRIIYNNYKEIFER